MQLIQNSRFNMAHEIEVQWMGKMQFNALINGHTVIMDAPERAGGEDNGPIPKPFVLSALAGCTGMDVAAMLRKAGIEMKDFNIKVSGEISKRAPIEYTAIHLIYEFCGMEENLVWTLQAVTDSQEKFCGVSSMLKKALPVTWEIKYNNQLVFSNKEENEVSTF